MLRKFLKEYKPFLKMFIAVLISSIFVSIVDLLIPTLTSYLINEGIATNRNDILFKIALVMIIIFIIRTILTYFVTYKGHMVGVSIEFSLRRKLFNKITSLPIKFFDKHSVGSLMSRITNDLNTIAEVAHHGPEDVCTMIIVFIGSTILMFMMNWQLALIIVILVPIIIIINKLSGKRFYETNLDLKKKISDINAQANDTFSGVRQVKAFTNEQYELNKFDYNNDRFFNSKKNMYLVMARYFASIKAYLGLLLIVTIIVGSYFVFNNKMNVGELTAFIMYVNLFQNPINLFSNFITDYNNALTGYARYLEIMKLNSQQDYPEAKEINDIKGLIEFKNVWFRYNKKSNYVLKDFNLVIKPGETVALVGESGVGKSTICNLINRYYEIEKGEILIDGINIKEFTLASLRQNIGLVSQDVFIFSGTFYDNISYGDLTKDDEAVEKACYEAKLEEVVNTLDGGYNAYIGERGVMLSGGQKQRLSLARVFLKNPPIMILDEATSALDNKTEKEIQKVIETLSYKRTNLVVAHRLSTIENADKIVVITKDGISEMGTHHDLMKNKAHYFELYTSNKKIIG
ncbi:MAG: ABC transporter ATP-binding protein/permease [Bacilli bacterium]|jgi:ATP-binding cassette subfamily B protein|nr:ABC transporter ATP-binding protein/permease [Bacilli bacterium]